jgi:hypothetical protein
MTHFAQAPRWPLEVFTLIEGTSAVEIAYPERHAQTGWAYSFVVPFAWLFG